MPRPVAGQPRTNPSEVALLNFHVDARMFGVVGDGVADDTTKLQSALDSGENIFVPSGNYKVTSTLNLSTTNPTRLSGAVGTNNAGLGAYIKGNVAGPIISRATSTELGGPIIKDLAVENTNAAGTAIYIDGNFVPAGISHCYIKAFKGIILSTTNNSNLTIANNRIVATAGVPAGSIGIYADGQALIMDNDVVGFDHGVRMIGGAVSLLKGRIEVCKVGIMMGQNLAGGSVSTNGSLISGIGMEACDNFIQMNNVSGAHISAINMLGSAGAPSGASVRGFYATGGALYTTVSGCTQAGTITSFADITGAGNKCVTFIDTSGTTWALGTGVDVSLIDCEINGVRKTRMSGPFAVPSKIEVTLTAGQNNWNPTGLDSASAIRMDNNGAYTLTGLVGGEEGRVLHLMNINGTNAITLAHESGSSTAANRFACPGGVNFAIPVAGGVDLFYDNNASIPRWRVISK